MALKVSIVGLGIWNSLSLQECSQLSDVTVRLPNSFIHSKDIATGARFSHSLFVESETSSITKVSTRAK